MAVDKRINYRDAGYVSQAYAPRSKPSAPKKSSPFSGNESRQQYSAKQTTTGAVKGGGKRGPDNKFTTSFVGGDRGRDSRDEFIRNVQKTNPRYTGGPPKNNFLSRTLKAGLNYARKNPQNIALGLINPRLGALSGIFSFLNSPEMRKRLTGYETQAEYDQARQDEINRNRIETLENTIQKKYLDKGRSLTETDLDERLAFLKENMGIQDTAPNVMTGRDLNLRGIETLDTGNNIIDNMISNIDKLSNQPNLQELYNRDRILSGMNTFVAPLGQTDYFPSQIDNTGINSLNLETPQQQAEDNFLKGAMAELTDKQKRFIDSKKFPLQENLVSPQSVYDTITNPDLGIYDTGTFGFGAQEPTTEEEYNDYLRSLGLTQTI